MKLLVDHADIELIKRLYEYYPIAGVTTNPSILCATGRPAYEVLAEIRSFIGEEADLYVQVISTKAGQMVEEGKMIAQRLGSNTFIKIPVTREGLKAIRMLAQQDYRPAGTTVYTVQQGLLAGMAWAWYVAPYVNRLDNLGGDGVAVTTRIHDVFRKNGLKTEVFAASFKNTQQILELAEHGIASVTAAPDVIEKLIANDQVTAAVDAFTRDFEKTYGAGATMLDG